MFRRVAFLGAGLFALGLGSAPVQAREPAGRPVISPEADVVLRQASDRLKKIKATSFRLVDTIDDVRDDGQKIQYSHVRKFTMVRPDKLKVEVNGDVTSRTLWLDGKNLTVLDSVHHVYAQIPSPGTVDQAIDMLQDKYGFSLPGVDLLTEDVYKNLTENCTRVDYVGVGFVNEEKCHHLAFVGDTIDYQLWVTTGAIAGPRKMLITYKELPGEPQYTLQLLQKDDASNIPDSLFTPEIPKDAKKITFQPSKKAE